MTQHYWRIHRKVCLREWRSLDIRSRSIIAEDVNHKSREFKDFENLVNSETERLYFDQDYYYNDPYTFKRPY